MTQILNIRWRLWFINTSRLQPTVSSCLCVYNSCQFLSINIQGRSRAEGIAVAQIPSALPWYDATHPAQTPGLPQRRCFRFQDKTRRLRAVRRKKTLLFFDCWTAIAGIPRILLQDSDPQRGHSPVEDWCHCLHGELLQNQHPAPAQQGGVHLEGRIFRGCADQNNSAALHVRQEGVLQITGVCGRNGKEITCKHLSLACRYSGGLNLCLSTCCDLLKRWISSMNRTVFLLHSRSSFCAWFITSRTSLVDALVADMVTKRAVPFLLHLLAIMWASVVWKAI